MKKMTIKVLGIITIFTLAIGVYSPTENNHHSVQSLMTHGDGGG